MSNQLDAVTFDGDGRSTVRPYSSRFGESVVSKVTASSHYTSRLVRGRTLGRASRQVVTPLMALANSQRPTANGQSLIKKRGELLVRPFFDSSALPLRGKSRPLRRLGKPRPHRVSGQSVACLDYLHDPHRAARPSCCAASPRWQVLHPPR